MLSRLLWLLLVLTLSCGRAGTNQRLTPDGPPAGRLRFKVLPPFPVAAIADLREATWVLTNEDLAPAENLNLLGLAPPFHQVGTTCTSTLEAGASCDIQVRFQPTAAGAFATSLIAEFSMVALPYQVRAAVSGICSEQPLTLRPEVKYLAVGSHFTFTATGGVAPYSFSLAQGLGSIDASTGAFVAASTPGDVVVAVQDAATTVAQGIVSVFDPGLIPDLQLWLRPEELAGLADGALLDAWPNAVATGVTASQSSASQQPTLRKAAAYGRDGVYFSESTLMVSDTLATTPVTIFCVYAKLGTTGTEWQRIYSSGQGGSDTGSGGAALVPDTPYNGRGSTLAPLLSVQNLGSTDLHNLRLGNSITGNAWYDGMILELMLFARQLSVAEQRSITSYLAGKHGLGATRIGIMGPAAVQAARCVPYELHTLDDYSRNQPMLADTNVQLSADAGAFYETPTCSTPVGTVLLAEGESQRSLYFADGVLEVAALTVLEAGSLRLPRPMPVSVLAASPQEIPNLVLWSAAETQSWLDDGERVMLLADGSGTDHPFKQGDPNLAPVQRLEGPNGNPALFFSTAHTTAPSTLPTGPASLFIVWEKTAFGGSEASQRIYSSGVGGMDIAVGGLRFSPEGGQYATYGSVLTRDLHAESMDLRSLRLGARNEDSNYGQYHGFVYELLLFDRALTVPEQQVVQSYLADKHHVAATRFMMDGPAAVQAESCTAFDVLGRGTGPRSAPVGQTTHLALQSTLGGFYADASCNTALTAVPLSAGSDRSTAYFSAASAGTATLTLTPQSGLADTLRLTVTPRAPTAIPNLAAWYAAEFTSYAADVNPIPIWPELSGHGPDLRQYNGDRMPAHRTVLFSHPAVCFDGDGYQDYLQSDDTLASAEATAFVVYAKPTAGGPSIQRLYSSGQGGVDSAVNGVYADPLDGIAATTAPVLSVNSFAGARDLRNLTLGGRNDAATYTGFAGCIYEFLLYQRLLTLAEQESVACYLSDVYQLGRPGC